MGVNSKSIAVWDKGRVHWFYSDYRMILLGYVFPGILNHFDRMDC